MKRSPNDYVSYGIIPGLGLILLKEYKTGIFALLLSIVMITITPFPPKDKLDFFPLIVFIYIWIWSFRLTNQIANRLDREQSGNLDLELDNGKSFEIPEGLNWSQREKWVIREKVQAQLETKEKVNLAFSCQNKGMFGQLFGKFYIGLTHDQMVVLEVDLAGKPLQSKKYRYSDIEWIELKKRILEWDILKLKLNSEVETIQLQINPAFREEIRFEFVEIMKSKGVAEK